MILPASLKGTSVGLGGAGSFGPMIGENLRHVAIEGSGHWVAEELPGVVTEVLLRFFSASN